MGNRNEWYTCNRNSVKIEGSRTEATIEPFVCKLAMSADKVDFSEVVLKSILDK